MLKTLSFFLLSHCSYSYGLRNLKCIYYVIILVHEETNAVHWIHIANEV